MSEAVETRSTRVPGKLSAVRKHFRARPQGFPAPEKAKRVQKNLRILEKDAARMKALAMRDGLSQAGLLAAALKAYELQNGSLD